MVPSPKVGLQGSVSKGRGREIDIPCGTLQKDFDGGEGEDGGSVQLKAQRTRVTNTTDRVH